MVEGVASAASGRYCGKSKRLMGVFSVEVYVERRVSFNVVADDIDEARSLAKQAANEIDEKDMYPLDKEVIVNSLANRVAPEGWDTYTKDGWK